jgi:hypothetical protein
MTKFRLPKPIAGNVIHRHLHLGSVYTKEQMRAFAEKAVLVEREACAKVAQETICDTHIPTGVNIYGTRAAKAIRARENT